MCCAPTIPQKIVKNLAKKYLTDLYQSLFRIVICKMVFLAHRLPYQILHLKTSMKLFFEIIEMESFLTEKSFLVDNDNMHPK